MNDYKHYTDQLYGSTDNICFVIVYSFVYPVSWHHGGGSHDERFVEEYNRHVKGWFFSPFLPLFLTIEQGTRRKEIRLFGYRGTALFKRYEARTRCGCIRIIPH